MIQAKICIMHFMHMVFFSTILSTRNETFQSNSGRGWQRMWENFSLWKRLLVFLCVWAVIWVLIWFIKQCIYATCYLFWGKTKGVGKKDKNEVTGVSTIYQLNINQFLKQGVFRIKSGLNYVTFFYRAMFIKCDYFSNFSYTFCTIW